MRGRPTAGFTTAELLVAATVGLVLTGAALSLCRVGNRVVGTLLRSQAAWQEVRAAASLWSADWRGAGYDPAGTAGAGIQRLAPETLEFTADWNANGALVPTGSNPNERLAYAAHPGAWRRGVNGGPRLPAAWPDSVRFVYRDGAGADLGDAPAPAVVRIAEVQVFLAGLRDGPGIRVGWAVARRNPP